MIGMSLFLGYLDQVKDVLRHVRRTRARLWLVSKIDEGERGTMINAPMIAIIDPIGKHAGLHYYVDGTARGLAANGYQVKVYVTSFTGVAANRIYDSKVAFGQLYGNDPTYLRALRYFTGLSKAVFWAWLAGVKVVNLHAFHHDLREAAAVWACRLAGMRVILTMHDVETFGSKRSSLSRRLSLSGARALVFQNAFSRQVFEQLGGPSAKKIAIVPHGHYIHAYPSPPSRQEARNSLKIDDNEFVLLFFGNPREEKGLDLLIRALGSWASKPGWKLVIAGKMRPAQEKAVRDLVSEAGIADHVRLDVGHISDEDASSYYRAADLVVIPYRRIYESGVTIMAMSMARAALVSDHEPLTEKIQEDVSGFVFASDNEASLLTSLNKAFENRERLDELGQSGYKKVLESRSWEQIGALLGKVAVSLFATK